MRVNASVPNFAAAICFVVGSFFATAASSAVTYTYTGPNFDTVSGIYTTSDNVTVILEFDDPLPVNLSGVFSGGTESVIGFAGFSFVASDGQQSIDSSTATSQEMLLSTNGAGEIDFWRIRVENASSFEIGTFNVSDFNLCFGFDSGRQSDNNEGMVGSIFSGNCDSRAGAWIFAQSDAVPEPSNMLLISIGMIGIWAARRRLLIPDSRLA